MSSNTFPSYRVAAIQTEPEIGNKEKNVSHMVESIRTAAKNGALLIVLPELANTGYVFNSREEAFSLAEPVPDGETCQVIKKLAEELKVYIVFGITEREGYCLYNSAAFFGPYGFIGKYRKNHLWCNENLFFEAGNLGMPVFKTPIGRIGILICYDGWFPELYRLASMQGADVICTCTNWVPMAGQPENTLVMANILAMGSAHVNSLNVICADRVGTEREQPFLGQSVIVGHEGWILAGPASKTKEETIYADINIKETREHRQTNAFNNIIRDRRDDLYAPMLGADMELPRW